MNPKGEANPLHVGPIIQAGALGHAVLQAIQDLNENVQVIDRGSYLRIQVPGRCVLTRAAIMARTGADFRFPGDLEIIMPSFKGRLSLNEEEAVWTLA